MTDTPNDLTATRKTGVLWLSPFAMAVVAVSVALWLPGFFVVAAIALLIGWAVALHHRYREQLIVAIITTALVVVLTTALLKGTSLTAVNMPQLTPPTSVQVQFPPGTPASGQPPEVHIPGDG